MALTTGSNIFRAPLKLVKNIAEAAHLKHLLTDDPNDPDRKTIGCSWTGDRYHLWEDRATGGGGCRLVYEADLVVRSVERTCASYQGVVWISRHSGYPQADITSEVAELFRESGCEELDHSSYSRNNPHIYGRR